MKTPKETAFYILKRTFNELSQTLDYTYNPFDKDAQQRFKAIESLSKECCLIVVNCIIETKHPNIIEYKYVDNDFYDQMTQEYYWEKVKEEIIKL